MNKLPLGTQVKLNMATYTSGSPVQGVITDYTLNGLYLVEIRGPHVAFYVEGIDNMTISTIVCHPDSISIIGEPRTGAGSLD